MLIRRRNWSLILTLAVAGPVLGAFVGAKFLPGTSCGAEKRQQSAAPPSTSDREEEGEQGESRLPTLRFPDGDQVAIDEIAPKRPVALVVMKGPWCPVCRSQIGRLSAAYDRVRSADAAVVGVSAAPPKQHRQLADAIDLNFPILSDPSGEFTKQLGLWNRRECHPVPGVVFLDESGEIAEVHRGRYPGKPQDQFVLETLRALGG